MLVWYLPHYIWFSVVTNSLIGSSNCSGHLKKELLPLKKHKLSRSYQKYITVKPYVKWKGSEVIQKCLPHPKNDVINGIISTKYINPLSPLHIIISRTKYRFKL